MFTVLIPAFRKGFLEAQLSWLSKQTFKGFNVLVMDAFYSKNKTESWINKRYPFPLMHVPMIHNKLLAKRFDLSVYNNLALLSPTTDFVFLEDTYYVSEKFAEAVYRVTISGEKESLFTVGVAEGSDLHNMQLKPVEKLSSNIALTVFDFKTFIYGLNGYEEALTYADCDCNSIYGRLLKYCGPKYHQTYKGLVFDILHSEDFPKIWDLPCEKCSDLFPLSLIRDAVDYKDFMTKSSMLTDEISRFVSFNPTIGEYVFSCPNCRFCGVLTTAGFNKANKPLDSFVGVFDIKAGRNLVELFEEMNKQVGNNVWDRIEFLKTTY
jgi:hypothetical protein